MTAAIAGAACAAMLVVLIAGRFRRRSIDARARRHDDRQCSDHSWSAGRCVTFATGLLRRRSSTSATDLAGILGDIARRCGSGESMTVGLVDAVAASSVAHQFAPAIAAIGRGATVDESLSIVGPTDRDERLAVHVLRLCATQGGAITESLDRAAATLRERDVIAAERRSQAAQARLSAHVLTLVPVGFAVWTLATSPAVAQFVATPIGLSCVGGGMSLNIAGWRLMNRAIGNR